MKNQLHFLVLLVVILLCFVACGKEQEPTIELKSAHQGETIDLCAPAIREYFDAHMTEII